MMSSITAESYLKLLDRHPAAAVPDDPPSWVVQISPHWNISSFSLTEQLHLFFQMLKKALITLKAPKKRHRNPKSDTNTIKAG